MRLKNFLFFGFVILCSVSSAQEMWGISNSNYAGNMGMGLNPAAMVNMPYNYEFNLVSGDLFINNNYIYLEKGKPVYVPRYPETGDKHSGFRDKFNTKPKTGYANIFLRGPSYIQKSGKIVWGIHTALRYNLSVKHLAYHFAKFQWESFIYNPLQQKNFTTPKYRAAAIGWFEIGGSLGKVVRNDASQYLSVAGTLNFNLGFQGMYANSRAMDYIVPNDSLLIVSRLDADYGHAASFEHGNIIKLRGKGFGMDVGAIYENERNESAFKPGRNETRKKYNYRVGVSLVDLGAIFFNKDAKVLDFDNRSTFWPGVNLVKLKSLDYADSVYSYQFYGDPDAAVIKNKFSVFLPTAIIAHFDYCIKPKYYANISVVQRIVLPVNQVDRANQVSLTARYETEEFEAALTYTFYEYYEHRLGIGLRYKWFVIGSDKFGPYTGLWDIYGFDFYFGFKFHSVPWFKSLKRRGPDDCYSR